MNTDHIMLECSARITTSTMTSSVMWTSPLSSSPSPMASSLSHEVRVQGRVQCRTWMLHHWTALATHYTVLTA